MTPLTSGLDMRIKHTHLQTLARDRTKNDRVKRLAIGRVRTVPLAELEPTCICIRIKITSEGAFAHPNRDNYASTLRGLQSDACKYTAFFLLLAQPPTEAQSLINVQVCRPLQVYKRSP